MGFPGIPGGQETNNLESTNMKQRMRWMALISVLTLIVAACGTDDAGTTETTGSEATSGDLSQCPNPLVMQTDWFPEPEHGALYNLTAGEGSIDPESGAFSGPLAADPSLTIEIRAGGPYIGFQPTVSLMYSDDSIFLGYVNTDEQIGTFEDTPTIAVLAPLEKNPQILMCSRTSESPAQSLTCSLASSTRSTWLARVS